MRGIVLSMARLVGLVSMACGNVVSDAIAAGDADFQSGNFEGAISGYSRAMEVAPEVPELSYNVGNAYIKSREFDEAVENLLRAAAEGDDSLAQKSLFNLGNAYYEGLQFEKAVEAYRESLRINPGDMDAKYNLELAFNRLQRFSPTGESEQVKQQLEEQNPEDNPEEEEKENEEPNPSDPLPAEEEDEDEDENTETEGAEIPIFSEDQARQLLDSVGRETQTLRGHLQQVLIVQKAPPVRDW